MSLHFGTGKGPGHLNRLPQGVGSVSPYALGVIAAGLQSVYDHRTDTGPTSSITSRTSVALPAGWASDVTSGTSKLLYEPSGGSTLSRWAFDNGQILGRGTCSLTDSYLNNPGVTVNESTCHRIGNLAAEAATYTRVQVDGAGMTYYDNVGGTLHLGTATLVEIASGSSLVANNSKFSGAPIVNVKGFDTILNHCFVGTFLNNPYPGTSGAAPPFSDKSHGEPIFIDGGTWGIRNTIVDCSDLNTDPLGLYTTTSGIFMQTNGADIVVDLTSSIFKGTMTQGASGQLSPIQLSCKAGRTLTITVTGCAIEKGTLSGREGYFHIAEQVDANSIHIIDGGGNYDLLTGVAIPSMTYQ